MNTEKKTSKKVVAAFDFDGTITTRDSLPYFIRFIVSKRRFFFGIILMTPYLFLFKVNIIQNFEAKEKLFKFFFKGMLIDDFNIFSSKFSKKIDQMVNPEAMHKIKWHRDNGHQVIIITASVENWIKPWAAQHGINTVIGTKLKLKDDKITGELLTKNCHGEEKVNRLLELYPVKDDYILYAYGDSSGDKNLLEIADHPFYRSFR